MITFIALITCTFIDPFDASVVSVHDGDTITIRTTETSKIRLYGIDAPELKQPHGQAAKHALSEMTFGKSVHITPMSKDRYGRIVAKVEAGGVDVNRVMVEQGNAWWYVQYAKYDMPLANAQSRAQAEKLGLWADPNRVAPWEFRKRKATK